MSSNVIRGGMASRSVSRAVAAPGKVGSRGAVRRKPVVVAGSSVERSPSPSPEFGHWNASVIAVVACCVGLAVAVPAVWVRPPFPWATVTLVAVLVAFLEARPGVAIPIGRGRLNFSAKAYASIGAVFLVGLPAAAATGLAVLCVGLVTRRVSAIKTLFNGAMSVLMFSGAYGAFHLLMSFAGSDVPLEIVAGAAGGLAAWCSNYLMLGTVLRAEQGQQRFHVSEFVRVGVGFMPYYLGYGVTGLGVVAASQDLGAPAALVILAAPVAIVQTATNRWMREQQARLAEAKSGFNATLISLSKAIDLRDKDTEGHCRRVVEYSVRMGRSLGFDDEELLRLCHGALLHDIGKIGVPDSILLKEGPLTDEEWAVMRTHPELGAVMVGDVKQLERAREVILNHHERYDGKGYPHGLKAEAIPLCARVFTIADSFDAMVSDRPYRKAMSLQEARAEVRRCSGTQFDPIAVKAFDSVTDEELLSIMNEKEQPTSELLSI